MTTTVFSSDIPDTIAADQQLMGQWLAHKPDTESVAGFVPGPGIQKLNLTFDIAKLRSALATCSSRNNAALDKNGFGAFSLTRRPGAEVETPNDLSGLFHTRIDDSYEEVAREEPVDEFAFTEFHPRFEDTYFKTVHDQLSTRFPIGRMRVLSKGLYNCNSWHRDPEPRLHIPIVSNPGSLFIVNHHVTHLPADGSVYFTDTRGYHTALNGGESERVHIVAALPLR
ncbi:MAG: hypothetical protein KTR32_23070 [Granulosicoccus sp.]|nr:hypothetical protein [Granulosicoccus sp.]